MNDLMRKAYRIDWKIMGVLMASFVLPILALNYFKTTKSSRPVKTSVSAISSGKLSIKSKVEVSGYFYNDPCAGPVIAASATKDFPCVSLEGSESSVPYGSRVWVVGILRYDSEEQEWVIVVKKVSVLSPPGRRKHNLSKIVDKYWVNVLL